MSVRLFLQSGLLLLPPPPPRAASHPPPDRPKAFPVLYSSVKESEYASSGGEELTAALAATAPVICGGYLQKMEFSDEAATRATRGPSDAEVVAGILEGWHRGWRLALASLLVVAELDEEAVLEDARFILVEVRLGKRAAPPCPLSVLPGSGGAASVGLSSFVFSPPLFCGNAQNG